MSDKRQSGAGLIEILVTLVIITVGLLGLAGLQLQGLRSSQAAHWQTQATTLSYDLIERMRANRSIAAQGGYSVSRKQVPSAPEGCYNRRCSPQELAQQDLSHWKSNLARQLPAGDGEVAVSMHSTGLEVLVTVLMQEPQSTDPTEFQLRTLL